ncbi:hypothetical protein AwDysgo_20710 [Bacteroidales bacterium]|nr:hypothetical protein AwDysgo_20710 [Bacteroidales bacterium]
MFKSKQVVTNGSSHNSLAAGTKIKGSVAAEEDFRIDGSVEGDIECKGKVVVGPEGIVIGFITCQNAEIMGTVKGNILTQGSLVLKSTAEYSGEATTRILEIEAGAGFNGTCTMIKDSHSGNRAKESHSNNKKDANVGITN